MVGSDDSFPFLTNVLFQVFHSSIFMGAINNIRHLQDHPRTCKWLITMVSKSPKDRVVGPNLQVAVSWLINGGDPFTTYIHWDDPPNGQQDQRLATVLFSVTFFACVFATVAFPAALLCVGPVNTSCNGLSAQTAASCGGPKGAKWATTSSKWSYWGPYRGPYKWVSGLKKTL